MASCAADDAERSFPPEAGMQRPKNTMMRFVRLICLIIFLFGTAVSVRAEEIAMEKIMPVPGCADGWTLDGKVILYDKDALFDRIDGESELYFPYGFQMLAYARYQNRQNPMIAIDADVYKMGSLLDAFGIFANYRRKDDAEAAVGGGGTVSSSQLFFFQDRYFVRLQITGTTGIGKDIFFACANAISKNLPQNAGRPKELDALTVPAVVKKSERYVAQSLLGYEFFKRGLIADAMSGKDQVQVFVVLEQGGEAAQKTFDQYRSYLKQSGSDARIAAAQGGSSLEAVDPLYGKIYVEQAGRFLIGGARFRDGQSMKQIVAEVRRKIGASEK